jgi:acyl-CoA synthetase (AMP-forming)/AMP-acid ligase II
MALHPPERIADYTARGWWDDTTIDAHLRVQVARKPDSLALVDYAGKAELTGTAPHRWTWAELDAEVDRIAAALLSAGLGAGDTIAVQLPNIAELISSSLAVIRIGAVLSPLPVQYREYEIRQLADLASFAAVITSGRIGDRQNAALVSNVLEDVPVFAFGPDLPAGVVALDAAAGGEGASKLVADHVAAHPLDATACVTVCWTSGTEGVPKGVPRSHQDWLAIAWAPQECPALTEDDVILNPFPVVNMAGISGTLLPWLRTGAVYVLHHPFSLPMFLRQIAEERATYTLAPPAILTLLLHNKGILAAADISSLRAIGSGSAPLPPSMVRGWQEQHGIAIINYFGSNEGIALVSAPADLPDPEVRASFFPRWGVPGHRWSSRMGDQVSVRLVDLATGEDITSPGRPGELRVAGPTVFAGYLSGTASADPFDEQGYLRTGDVFEIAGADGELLRHVDRAKDLIIRGGMNIAPVELEGLLMAHPGVADVAVIGYPDEVLGERVCAVVVAKPDQALTGDDLLAHLRERQIASYKLPERFEFVDALPRNPVGKVLKRDLRASLTREADS